MYNHYTPKSSPALHDPIRHELERQVKAYLDQGGKIEVLPAPQATPRPIASAWQMSASSLL